MTPGDTDAKATLAGCQEFPFANSQRAVPSRPVGDALSPS